MIVFEIRKSTSENTLLGYLFYYEKSKRFYSELLSIYDEWEAPFIFWKNVKEKRFSIDSEQSLKFVSQRIIPPDRQNLGLILRDNKLKEYDEYKLLKLSEGRCSQDDLYIKKIEEDEICDEIKERLKKNIKDVVALKNNRVLAFFKDGKATIYDVEKYLGKDRFFSRILSYYELFTGVRVTPGGKGIEWSSTTFISSKDLYDKGKECDLSYDDFLSFSSDRLIDTSTLCEMMGCTRQYVNQLVKENKLEVAKAIGNNNLFRKADIESEVPF